MRSALAFKHETEEVPVSSNEVLEVHVAVIRADVDELKKDFRDLRAEFQAVTIRLENEIKASAEKLQAEINGMAARATKDVDALAARMDAQFARVDAQFARVDTQFSEVRQELRDIRDKLDKTTEAVYEVAGKQKALLWVVTIVGTLVTLFSAATTLVLMLGKRFGLF